MKIKDDRTPAQKKTHHWLVVGSDRARLSGQPGFKSYAAWACTDADLHTVQDWVNARKDMLRVRTVGPEDYRPKGTGECHIYVVDDSHPAVARHYKFKAEMPAGTVS